MTMTPLHKRILDDVLCPYIREFGYSPTRKEIASALGQSVSSVNQTLYRMRDRGIIKIGGGWRAIEINPARAPYGGLNGKSPVRKRGLG